MTEPGTAQTTDRILDDVARHDSALQPTTTDAASIRDKESVADQSDVQPRYPDGCETDEEHYRHKQQGLPRPVAIPAVQPEEPSDGE